MKIALTTDHAGYELLKALTHYIESLGHECIQFGPTVFDPNDDYPDFMFPAAEAVQNGSCDRGIIMGGSGQGEAMSANRFHNVRCALFYGPVLAKSSVDITGRTSDNPYEIIVLSRQHNNANMLSLSARFLSMNEMETAVRLWLETPYIPVERHQRRIVKLSKKGS